MATLIEQERLDRLEAKGGGKSASGPLAPLDSGLGEDPKLYYPIDLPTKYDHFMSFAAYKEHAFQGSLNATKRTNFAKLGTAYLPMPSNLTTGYQQEYKEAGVGAAGMTLGAMIGSSREEARSNLSNMARQMQSAVSSDDPIKNAKALGSMAFKGMKRLGDVGGMSAAMNIATGEVGIGAIAAKSAVAGAVAAKGIQVATAIAGTARNPHMAVLYDTPKFRQFEFGFEMRPKNLEETRMIDQIIYFFKFFSHPEYEFDNHFFKYPNQFKLNFKHPDFLFEFQDCVCTAVNVDYHGEGTPLYIDVSAGGRKMKAPAVVKLQLQFQEVKILTKKEILKRN